jgi:hypothetical protein
MKTTTAILALSAFASSAFCQGQVQFQNTIVSQLYFNTTAFAANKVTSGTIASQTEYGSTSTGVVDVGLFWSTTVFTDPAQGTLADVVTMNPTTPGTIAGGLVTLPGTSAGERVFVQVYAWDSMYANPDAAMAAGALFAAWSAGPNNSLYGAVGAPELTDQLTVSPGPPIPIFGTGPGQFGRAVITPLPEPGTLALSGVGAVALWLVRRRK